MRAYLGGTWISKCAVLVLSLLFLSSCAQVRSISLMLNPEKSASTPRGFVSFCLRYPEKCRHNAPRMVNLTTQRWSQLVSVNHLYNTSIEQRSDLDQHGVPESWDIPVKYGDCEDYVLAKKAHLSAAGWPPSALLISVVDILNVPPRERRHAVLLVITNKGYYVLDSRTDKIKPWNQSRYHWVSVQSAHNPLVWHRVDQVVEKS